MTSSVPPFVHFSKIRSHFFKRLAPAFLLVACGEETQISSTYDFGTPPQFPQVADPATNPTTAEKVELGRYLFYDKRLSLNETMSWGSCHQQKLAFTDGLALSEGSTGDHTPRGSMSTVNMAYASTFTWANPVLKDLEAQALVPMFGESPIELGLSGQESVLIERLKIDPKYPGLFQQAFPEEESITIDLVVKAIASFERSIVSYRSDYDRYQAGETSALSESALRGKDLFFGEKYECFHCHGGFNFTTSVDYIGLKFDETRYENNGLYNLDEEGSYPEPNQGLYEFSGDPGDKGRFKAPTLRNVEFTAPYMHDGSILTLEAVIEHYAAGGTNTTSGPNQGDGRLNPNKSRFVRSIEATDEEKLDLLNFLKSLSDHELIQDPRWSDPFEEAL